MQAIQIAEGLGGSVLILMCLDTSQAHLLLVGASGMPDEIYAEAWDEAVRFCWRAGWEPRQDDADLYVASIDTEFYRLIEVDEAGVETDTWDEEASIG